MMQIDNIKPLHIFFNEDNLSDIDKFSDLIDDLNIPFIEVRNIRQFNTLISILSDKQKVFVWIHPNFSRKQNTGSTTSGEVCIDALKSVNIQFRVVTRYKRDLTEEQIKQLGGEVYEITEITNLLTKIQPQTIGKLKGVVVEIPQKIDIAVVCAIDDELKYILELFDNIDTQEETFIYHIGKIIAKSKDSKNHEVNIVAAKQDTMGMVDCAFLISRIIKKYNPTYLIMTGVCGGRKSRGVKIGDIIIPRLVYTYQKGKLTDKGFETRPDDEKISIDLKQLIDNDKCRKDIPAQIALNWNKRASQNKKNPKVWLDPMACGDIIVNKKDYIEEIVSIAGQTELAGLDMESYSILRAANIYKDLNIKPIVIKSVMDYTDKKSNKYKDYAAYVSAQFFYYLATDVLNL